MTISFLKNYSFIFFIPVFFLFSCQTSKVEEQQKPPEPVKQINYKNVFEAALKASGNRLNYEMQERVDKAGSIIYTAKFNSKMKTSFQNLEMTLLKTIQCTEDTPPQGMKQISRGVGPSGASSDISFCSGTQSIKLTDSNRLSMSDHPHGIGLVVLAKNIQIEAKK